MARDDTSIPYQLLLQAGAKLFIAQLTLTTAASVTNIPANTADGTPIPAGALLALQAVDGNFNYRFVAASAAPGTTANNSIFITQSSIEFAHPRARVTSGSSGNIPADGAIDGLAASGTVHVNVFLVV